MFSLSDDGSEEAGRGEAPRVRRVTYAALSILVAMLLSFYILIYNGILDSENVPQLEVRVARDCKEIRPVMIYINMSKGKNGNFVDISFGLQRYPKRIRQIPDSNFYCSYVAVYSSRNMTGIETSYNTPDDAMQEEFDAMEVTSFDSLLRYVDTAPKLDARTREECIQKFPIVGDLCGRLANSIELVRVDFNQLLSRISLYDYVLDFSYRENVVALPTGSPRPIAGYIPENPKAEGADIWIRVPTGYQLIEEVSIPDPRLTAPDGDSALFEFSADNIAAKINSTEHAENFSTNHVVSRFVVRNKFEKGLHDALYFSAVTVLSILIGFWIERALHRVA